MGDTKALHELCETVIHEIEDMNKKLAQSGGKISAGDVDVIDKLTHTLKSLETTIAMKEADGGGYSQRYAYGRDREGYSMWGEPSYSYGPNSYRYPEMAGRRY